jgi:hypothetical protein
VIRRRSRWAQARLLGRKALAWGLTATALGLAGLIWVTYHWLEPLCVWCAAYEWEDDTVHEYD